jgi:hypothetical protein
MRQVVQRGASSLNADPKEPEGRIAVLREAGAKEATLPAGGSPPDARPEPLKAAPSSSFPPQRPPSMKLKVQV